MNFIERLRYAELYQRDTDYLLVCYDDEHQKVSETPYIDLDAAIAAGEAWKTSWRE